MYIYSLWSKIHWGGCLIQANRGSNGVNVIKMALRRTVFLSYFTLHRQYWPRMDIIPTLLPMDLLDQSYIYVNTYSAKSLQFSKMETCCTNETSATVHFHIVQQPTSKNPHMTTDLTGETMFFK
jgi:hypothetical protein